MELVRIFDFRLDTTTQTLQNLFEGWSYQKWEYDKCVSAPETEALWSVRRVSLDETLKPAAAHQTPAAVSQTFVQL